MLSSNIWFCNFLDNAQETGKVLIYIILHFADFFYIFMLNEQLCICYDFQCICFTFCTLIRYAQETEKVLFNQVRGNAICIHCLCIYYDLWCHMYYCYISCFHISKYQVNNSCILKQYIYISIKSIKNVYMSCLWLHLHIYIVNFSGHFNACYDIKHVLKPILTCGQDCGISFPSALEIPQSCANPSIWQLEWKIVDFATCATSVR